MSGKSLLDPAAIIQDNWTFLLDNIDVKSLVDKMFEAKFFTSSDLEEIAHRITQREKSTAFLNKLKLAGPSAFQAFLAALRSGNQAFVAERLENYEPPKQVQGAEGGIPKQDSDGGARRESTSSSGTLKCKFEDRRIKLVAVGVQGSGKSTTCNRILGEEIFKTSPVGVDAPQSQKESGIKFDHHILIVDTPGLSTFEDFDKKKFMTEMKNALKLAEDSPQAFVCVVAIGQSVLEITTMLKLFEKHLGEAVFKYMVFVFTNTDKLKKGEKIENIIHSKLKVYLEKCGNRFVVFTRDPDQTTKDEEVKELLDVVHTMVKKNSPSCYKMKERSCITQ